MLEPSRHEMSEHSFTGNSFSTRHSEFSAKIYPYRSSEWEIFTKAYMLFFIGKRFIRISIQPLKKLRKVSIGVLEAQECR